MVSSPSLVPTATASGEAQSSAAPLPVEEWKVLVGGLTRECLKTTFFLSRDDERGLSSQSGRSDWNDRMSGYDAVDSAEASGRHGRDRALEALGTVEPTSGASLADVVTRALAVVGALSEARECYPRKGVSLVVGPRRKLAAGSSTPR